MTTHLFEDAIVVPLCMLGLMSCYFAWARPMVMQQMSLVPVRGSDEEVETWWRMYALFGGAFLVAVGGFYLLRLPYDLANLFCRLCK
jgi:hypothetical protein